MVAPEATRVGHIAEGGFVGWKGKRVGSKVSNSYNYINGNTDTIPLLMAMVASF